MSRRDLIISTLLFLYVVVASVALASVAALGIWSGGPSAEMGYGLAAILTFGLVAALTGITLVFLFFRKSSMKAYWVLALTFGVWSIFILHQFGAEIAASFLF